MSILSRNTIKCTVKKIQFFKNEEQDSGNYGLWDESSPSSFYFMAQLRVGFFAILDD